MLHISFGRRGQDNLNCWKISLNHLSYVTMKIYTKTGDEGFTSLVRGTRVMKDNIRVESYGTIDELNSFIGLLSNYIENPFLETIQKSLFRIGGFLADETMTISRIDEDDLATLEEQIDYLELQVGPRNSFILPMGNDALCLCHICRTICRRAERRMIAFKKSLDVDVDRNPFIYINRLSDYFFILGQSIK